MEKKKKTIKLKVPKNTIRAETTRGTGGTKGKERTGSRTAKKRRGQTKSGPSEAVGGVTVSFCGDSDVTEIKDIADMDLSLLRTAGTDPNMDIPSTTNVPPVTNVPHTQSAEDILRMLDELMPREWVAIEEANVQDVIPNTPGMAMWEMRDINSETEQITEMAFKESIRVMGGGVGGPARHGCVCAPLL